MNYKNLEDLMNADESLPTPIFILICVIASLLIVVCVVGGTLTIGALGNADKKRNPKILALSFITAFITLILALSFFVNWNSAKSEKAFEGFYENVKSKYKVAEVTYGYSGKDSHWLFRDFAKKKDFPEFRYGNFDVILESGVYLSGETHVISMDVKTGEPFMVTDMLTQDELLRVSK